MTTQRVFQLRRNALRNDAGKCQRSDSLGNTKSVPVPVCPPSPMAYPGIELEPPLRQPPTYTLCTPAHSMFHIRVFDTITAASEHHTTASRSDAEGANLEC
jgi:hypothetical protein